MLRREDGADQVFDALKNPAHAHFPVTYQFFVNPNREIIAHLDKEIKFFENKPASFFAKRPEQFTSAELESKKKTAIENIKANAPDSEELMDDLITDTEKYIALKKYFEEKVRELGIKNPLIFYDDKALRIDIGYGPKEFQALFPNFANIDGIFKKTLHNNISSFGKPLGQYLSECLHEDYKKSLEAEQTRLIKKAEIEFTKQLPSKSIPKLSDTSSETQLIKDCLQENRGVVVGERHGDKSSKEFLIDNMALLKSQGVTTLYMEHLIYESHQELLDEYLKSPNETPMPKKLELYLRHLDNERKLEEPTTFTSIIRAAKENGIRIIAIDNEATYQVGVKNTVQDLTDSKGSEDRYKVMNMSMLERLTQYDDGGKYVAFIGSGHVSTCQNVPGVSDLLGCPNIVVHDLEKNQPQVKVEVNAQYTAEKTTLTFDILYHRSFKTNLNSKNVVDKQVEDKHASTDSNINSTKNINQHLDETAVRSVEKAEEKREHTLELAILNSMIKTVVSTEQFEFNDATKNFPYSSFRLHLDATEVFVAQNIAKILSDNGIRAELKYNDVFPVVIINCEDGKKLLDEKARNAFAEAMKVLPVAIAQDWYKTGMEAEQNHRTSRAVICYKEAAKLGHVQAQLDLGRIFENGNGVSKDLEQAKYWYSEAAKSGNSSAKTRLEVIETELSNQNAQSSHVRNR